VLVLALYLLVLSALDTVGLDAVRQEVVHWLLAHLPGSFAWAAATLVSDLLSGPRLYASHWWLACAVFSSACILFGFSCAVAIRLHFHYKRLVEGSVVGSVKHAAGV
jgi:hypothetical protein